MVETIKEAAIFYRGKVYTGHRHHNIIYDLYTEFQTQITGEIQGFVTSTNRFVTRQEALEIAIASGQVTKPICGWGLFSEDLY